MIAINASYLRHNIMADVNYYSRVIWNIANGFKTSSDKAIDGKTI